MRMKLLNISITEYASIKNRSLELTSGLNIIEGENESGKSSILSFIKFILYGLPRRSSGEVVSEKERSFSWDGGIAAGSMTIETDEGVFRIERSAREGMRGDKVSIIDVSTGTQVHKGEVPGELFLGVPAGIFESTAFVRQLACGSIDGGEIGSAIQNLLLSADETLDSQRAIAKIDSIRRKLWHKTKQGGSIYELTQKRDMYASKLREASERAVKINEYETALASADKLCRDTLARLEDVKALCEAHEKKQKLIRLDSLDSTKNRIASIENEINDLKNRSCHDGFIPDVEYRQGLALAERELSAANDALEKKKEELAGAKRAVPAPDERIGIVEKLAKYGGAHGAASELERMTRLSSRLKSFALTELALTFIAGILAVLSLVFGLGIISGEALPASLKGALAFILNSPMKMTAVFGALTLVFLALTVILFVRSGKFKRNAESMGAELKTGSKRGYAALKNYFDSCEKACEAKRSADERLALAEKNVLDAENEKKKCRSALAALLLYVGREPGENEDILLVTDKVIRESAELCDRLSTLKNDLAKYSTLAEERAKETADLDRAELSRALTPELDAKLSDVNITALHREHDFLRAKHDSARQKYHYYDRELIGLRATGGDPARSEAQLRKTETRLKEEIALFEALTLASETLAEASEVMKKNVTPMLRASAGALMSRFTAGKYTELGLSSDFKLTVNAGGITRPIEALSAGTRDAAYLSLRISLAQVLYRSEKPPLLFDEVLSQIDNTRASALLSMLEEYCGEGRQCLLFSCHSREAQMASAGTNIIKL